MSSILKVDTIQDQAGNNIINESGNVITIGASGDTITVPAGATVSGFTSAGIDDNATSVAITIDSSERVGIGTTSPSFEFEVKDASGPAVIRVNNGGDNKIVDLIADSTGGLLRTVGSYPLVFNTNQTERMRIDSSGKAVIGKTTVDSEIANLMLFGSSPGTASAGQLGIQGSETTGAINTGAGIAFKGHNGGGNRNFGDLKCQKENSSSGDNLSYMSFATRNASGVAERLRISSSGKVGIGSTAPDTDVWSGANSLVVKDTSGDGGITIVSSSTSNNGNIAFADSSGGSFSDVGGLITYLHNGDSFRFMTGNAERMRLNSTGLGIGTSSPIAPLHISGTAPIIAFTETDQSNKQYKVGSFGAAFAIRDDTAGQYRYTIDTNGNHIFNEGSQNTSFRIESNNDENIFKVDGNTDRIGIGEGTPLGKLHVKSADSGASVNGGHNQVIAENSANSGMSILSGTSSNGAICFGDSGNNCIGYVNYAHNGNHLSFGANGNEAMRIDNNRNIFIGSTANYDSAKVVIAGVKALSSGIPQQGLNVVDTTAQNTGVGGGITFSGKYTNGGGITTFGSIEGSKANNTGGNYGGELIFKTRQHGNDNLERMRILSNGNVGIGKTDPTVALQVLGQISLITPTNGNGMSTNCIGTPANYYFDVRDDNTAIFRIISNRRIQTNGTTNRTGHLNLIGEVGASSKAIVFEHTSDGGEVGTIKTASSSTSYNTSSDYRLKENVSYDFDATTRLKQLKPARFNFIKDADTTVDGFIAHEVSSIVPEAITGEKDELQVWEEADELPEGVSVGDNKLDENANTIPEYQGIDQSKLVPLLVKTIQELEARITTLEANN